MTKILKSKFYIAKGLEVYPKFGTFLTATRADRFMCYVKEKTESYDLLETKPEFKGYRSVSGARVLKFPARYKIIE